MKFLKNSYKNVMRVVAIVMAITLISSTSMLAATNKSTNKDKTVLQVEKLIAQAEKMGIVITKDTEYKGVNSLSEEELTDTIALLSYAIENHSKVKQNELKSKSDAIKVKSENTVQSPVQSPVQSIVGGATTYDVRHGSYETNVYGTIPYNGLTKNVSTSVVVYARWANKCVGNIYNDDIVESFYKVGQCAATRGTSINIGNIKSFTQRSIAMERPTATTFMIVGTGTFSISYGGLVIDFFVPFQRTFSIDEGTFSYTSTSAPF